MLKDATNDSMPAQFYIIHYHGVPMLINVFDLMLYDSNAGTWILSYHSYMTGVITLTFKEDKVPLTIFIDGINARWQSPPEDTYLHRISIHYFIFPNSPEPLIL